jgi:hypothetical protein
MELKLLVENRESKTKRRAEKISKKVIQSIEGKIKKAAAKGLTELTIMSVMQDSNYVKGVRYDSGFESYKLAEEIVRQYCEGLALKATIKRRGGGLMGEQYYTDLDVSW